MPPKRKIHAYIVDMDEVYLNDIYAPTSHASRDPRKLNKYVDRMRFPVPGSTIIQERHDREGPIYVLYHMRSTNFNLSESQIEEFYDSVDRGYDYSVAGEGIWEFRGPDRSRQSRRPKRSPKNK